MSPSATRPAGSRPLRVADVALFYGERSGGIRTYLEAKAAFAQATGSFEHHLLVPGKARRSKRGMPAPLRSLGDAAVPSEPAASVRHELPSLLVTASNGYRVPFGGGDLHTLLRSLRPDVVLLHDPFWTPISTTRIAHEIGAAVVAVHHGSVAMQAAGLPGPAGLWRSPLKRAYRRAYADVDAVMSVVDPRGDADRSASLTLHMGLDPAFTPQYGAVRGDHVLYAGRLAPEKGAGDLIDAAGLAGVGGGAGWELRLIGSGQARDALAARARRLGIADRVRFLPFASDRVELARAYAEASCVVMPGQHETFGFVALEAAACGARVVAADSAPSGRLVGPLGETFRGGDAPDLLLAIERARAKPRDLEAAETLAERHTWPAAIAAELEQIEALVGALRPERVATASPASGASLDPRREPASARRAGDAPLDPPTMPAR